MVMLFYFLVIMRKKMSKCELICEMLLVKVITFISYLFSNPKDWQYQLSNILNCKDLGKQCI